MADDTRGFPFASGSAREVRDPAAEAEKLAGARKAAEAVTIRRSDLDALLAVAGLYLTTFAEAPEEAFNGLVSYEAVKEAVARYGERF